MKNKRANIPIIILVLGVLAVCGVVLLNFTLFKKNYNEDFNCLNIIEQVNSIAEKFKFYESIDKDPNLAI